MLKKRAKKPPNIDPNTKGKYYKKPYKLNKVGRDRKTTTVAIPREVIERSAEKAGLPLGQFIDEHEAIVTYNSFDGVFIAFKKKQ